MKRIRANEPIKYDVADEPIILSKAVMDKLLTASRPAEAIALYCFYYYTAKWQRTNAPIASIQYSSKGLGWGHGKVRSIKNVLRELDLIEDVQVKNPKTHAIISHHVQLYIAQSHPTGKPPSGKSDIKNILPNRELKKVNKKNFLKHFSYTWRQDEYFQEAVQDFIHMRYLKDEGQFTERAMTLASNKLKKYSIQIATEALKESIMKKWSGVFPEGIQLEKSVKAVPDPIEILQNTFGINSRATMVIRDVYNPAKELLTIHGKEEQAELAQGISTMFQYLHNRQRPKAKKSEAVPDPLTIIIEYTTWLDNSWVDDHRAEHYHIDNTVFTKHFLPDINKRVGRNIITGDF